MYNKIKSNKKIGASLGFIFFLFYMHAFFDVTTSSVTGNGGESRGGVYIALVGLVIIMTIYLMLNLIKRKIYITPINSSLIFITIWIISVNMYRNSSLWISTIHLGFSIFWIIGYTYFVTFVRNNTQSYLKIEKYIFTLQIIYFISIIYYFIELFILKGRIPVLNIGYNVVLFLPWIYISKNKKVRNYGTLFAIIAGLMSMKRGAYIALAVIIIINLLIDKKISINTLFKLCGVFIMILILIFITDKLTDGFIGERFSFESLKSGSGRDTLYSTAINEIMNRDLIDLMIGYGSGSSIELLGTGVHNEILEFIYSFGIVGLILYMNMYISLIYSCIKIKNREKRLFGPYMMMIIYMAIVSNIGGIYFMHSSMYISTFFGTVDGLKIRKIEEENNKSKYEKSRYYNV